MAITDNFFKGGETVRGFAPLGYGPRDQYGTPGTPGAGVALGGKNFVVGTAEVQFPLPMMPPDFGLRGAVFADAGMLFGVDTPAGCPAAWSASRRSTTRRSARRSAASIIWASPFGPLRVDFAQALNKQSYDKTQFFRFGAGAAF